MQKTRAPAAKDLRIFALILTIGFLVIGFGIPYLKAKTYNHVLIYIAAAIFIVGMLTPKLLIYPRKGWIAVGEVMGKINSTILFTFVYILIFTTVGLIFRMFKRDRLKKEFRKVNSTMVMKNEISTFEEPF
ncbi:MAG: hypothetical protein H7177_00235 [Rhizobacter sp.]|nr:hypothetical protein [Bacteriovorax sp.]